MFDRSEMIEKLDEFNNLYSQRPIRDNSGGMKSPHMFPAWFIIKKLKPITIIESGVWKGLGTWFFRAACPTSRIISIDPEPKFREYTDPLVTYQTEDFLTTDWSNIEKDSTLVFFDDHQDSIIRLRKCVELGFNKIIVEDNYPYQQGDCYTPKKVISDKDYVIDSNGLREWHPRNVNDRMFFNDNMISYREMPPIFKDNKTRWGDDWNYDNYPTPQPLLGVNRKHDYPEFYQERFDYTWICYIVLKQKETNG